MSPGPSGGMGAGLRPLLACADDLGVDPRNDGCILELLQAGRLSGASLLVDGPHALRAGRLARSQPLGLHVNLTQSFGQPFHTRRVRLWIQAAWRGRIDRDAELRGRLGAEIDRQLRRFRELVGREPAYVDGHEHVHGLPGLSALLAERLAAIRTAPVPVRNVKTRSWRGAKAEIISRLCGVQAAPAMNADFLGIYPLDRSQPYGRRVAAWLQGAGERPLLMCHPGAAAGAMPHGAARAAEAAYLASEAWPQALGAAGRHLIRAGEGWPLSGQPR